MRAKSTKPPLLQYGLLALLFLITAAYQIRNAIFVVEILQQRAGYVSSPFEVSLTTSSITSLREEAQRAGIRTGDALLAINGRAYRGRADLSQAVLYARPGDMLSVTVRHKNGEPIEQTVQVPLAHHESTTDAWYFAWSITVALGLVLPLSCVLLGFWVAAVRPWEPMAWLLLALLLGFSQLVTLGEQNLYVGLASNLAQIYQELVSRNWLLWLFLLGIYFPTPLKLERKVPWLKWLLIVPLGAGALIGVVWDVAITHNYSALPALKRHPHIFFAWINPLQLAALGLFFLAVFSKYFQEHSADAKRRLRLLYVGMVLSLVPIFTLVAISSTASRDIDSYPAWVELPCLLLTLLFPLTLAYLIVVHKALGVSVVIRQGVQYTLARGGITILQMLLTAALVVIISVIAVSHRASLAETIVIVSIGIAIIFLIRRFALRLAAWIDRRFFREEYDAEMLLAELGEKVRTIIDTRLLLETVSRRIAESLHVPLVAVLLDGGKLYRPAYAVGYGSIPDVALSRGAGTLKELAEGNAPSQVYFDDPNNWVNRRSEVSDEERAQLAELQSEVLVPLSAKEKLLGFISLGQKRSEEPYSNADLRLLHSVAGQAGLALENARLTDTIAEEAGQREAHRREVEIAREVQERLLPQDLPLVPGLDYCGHCRPALGVGGDYYDFLPLSNGHLGIAIGDVSGKGISAALMMASLQASLRGQTILAPHSLTALMARVNRLLYEASSSNRYATFFFGEYDPQSRELHYVNAGHNPPVLLRKSGDTWQEERLEVGGTVVGLLREFSYQQATVVLRTGDVLVAFTDGVSESMNPGDEEWGEEPMIEVMQRCHGLSAADTVIEIMKGADTFAAGAKQHDDMTLVVARCVMDGVDTGLTPIFVASQN